MKESELLKRERKGSKRTASAGLFQGKLSKVQDNNVLRDPDKYL